MSSSNLKTSSEYQKNEEVNKVFFNEERVGLAACCCWAEHFRIKIKKCGYFMLIVLILVCLGLFVPYIISVIAKYMPPLIPFISQSGGSPPSSGAFTSFMVIASFFGVLAFTTFYETINHRNTKDLRIIRVCNKVSLVVILFSLLGLIIVISNPVGYTDVPNKFEWVTTVLYEHGFGATMVLAGGAIFQYLLVVIWWYLPDTTSIEKYIKISFAVVYFIFFLIIIYPMPAFLLEELGPNPFDLVPMKNATYALPLEYSTVYNICSVCEWALVILSMINFITHFQDLQRVSFTVTLRPKSCMEEEDEPVPSISLNVLK